MFGKKIRCRCGKKIDLKYEFCPHCGTPREDLINHEKSIKSREQLLDKEIDHLTKAFSENLGIPAIASFPFKMFVKKMSKDIEKQFREMDQEMSRMQHIQNASQNTQNLNVPANAKKSSKPIIQNGKKVGDFQEFNFPGGSGFSIQIQMGGDPRNLIIGEPKDKEKKITLPNSIVSEAESQKFLKLPRHEPETKVRRLTDKIVYEISLPGVKNERDITINKLQNSIEIKAFSKDNAYFKLIPLAFPIKSWKLKNQILILELKTP